MAIMRKRKNTIWRIKDALGIPYDEHGDISSIITKEFGKRFKVDNSVFATEAIPLSKDILDMSS